MLLTERYMQIRDMTEEGKNDRLVAIFIEISQELVQFHMKKHRNRGDPVFKTDPKG
jgi:DNA-binding CsgD family transcriptional regulator